MFRQNPQRLKHGPYEAVLARGRCRLLLLGGPDNTAESFGLDRPRHPAGTSTRKRGMWVARLGGTFAATLMVQWTAGAAQRGFLG